MKLASSVSPLTPSALEILKRRYEDEEKHAIWVFPSDRRGRKTGELSHLSNPKEAWKRILKRAGITNLRIHDLRRTAGSYMAIQGVSPTIFGKALGHRSQAATAMYARLTQDPVRQAMINAQQALAMPKKILRPGGDLVEMKRKSR
jgi:integrase